MWGWSVLIPYAVLPKILASGSTAASFPSSKPCNTSCSLSFGIIDHLLVQDTWPNLDPFPPLSSIFVEPLFNSSLNYANSRVWTHQSTKPELDQAALNIRQLRWDMSSTSSSWAAHRCLGMDAPLFSAAFLHRPLSPCPLQEGYPCSYGGRRCIWEESMIPATTAKEPKTISHGQRGHALSSVLSSPSLVG